MTASEMTRQKRRTTGLTVSLLGIATIGLAIACAALGQEVLNLDERVKEVAEIKAHLPGLRAERDSLVEEIATNKAELSSLRTQAEEAQAIASTLPNLQAEESRTRAERDRLAKEVAAFTADRDTLRGTFDMLAERRRSLEVEVDGLASRAEAERKRLIEVQQTVNEKRAELTQTTDTLAAKTQTLAQVETELANADRLLDSKRAEIKGLTAEEQNLRAEVARMKKLGEELETGSQREAERLASLEEAIVTARTTLSTAEGERDRARDELARTQAILATETAQAEAVAARLQRLTILEATARQQIRTMIEDLNEAERVHAGSESQQ